MSTTPPPMPAAPWVAPAPSPEFTDGDVLYLEDMSSTIVRRKISLQMLGVKPTPAAHAILTQLIQ